jgi:hypothetical protein
MLKGVSESTEKGGRMGRTAWDADRLLLGFVAMLAVIAPAHAQYKCTGADGAISFQQAPCASNHQQSQIQLRDRGSPGDSATGQATVDWKLKAAELDWQRTVREAIASGRVVVGMSRDQLYQAIGAPAKINAGQYGARSKDQLIYYRNNRTLYVYVDDGFVSAIQDTSGGPAIAEQQRKPCLLPSAIRNLEMEMSKLQNRDNHQLQVELQRLINDGRNCR